MQNNPATSGARGMSSKLVGRRGKPPGAHVTVNCVNICLQQHWSRDAKERSLVKHGMNPVLLRGAQRHDV